MSKFNWRNGFAVGIVAGFGIAILVFLSATFSIEPLTSAPASCEGAGNDCAQNGEGMPQGWYWLRRLFAFEDTIAQWIMMVFTIVAAGLLLATLKATQDMAKETARIGEAQVRAYPSVTSVNVVGITNGLPSVAINVRNSGNSPALRMKCRGRLVLTYQEDVPPRGTVAQCGMEISLVSDAQVAIAPNVEGKIRVYVPHLDEIERNSTMKEMSSNTPRKNPFWMVNIFFDWVDVFDAEYTFYINAEQRPSGIPAIGKEGVLTEMVLSRPFDISYQSESRDRSET